MQHKPFSTGIVYKRSHIHDEYGGTRFGGISSPAKYPYILIFTGESGDKHGYQDHWETENVFSYTGEGQVGDMKFMKGNLALRNHINEGKRVFLFTDAPQRSHVLFVAELILIDIDYFEGLDREENERKAIRFFFKRSGSTLPNEKEFVPGAFQEIDYNRTYNTPSITERKGLVTSRVGQGAYRKSILYRWNHKCAVTGYSNHKVLIASHILPWKDSTSEQRLDVNNGILLSPLYDALFDQNLISFDRRGKIILSKVLLETNYPNIGISGNEVINNLSSDNYYYLEKHIQFLL